MRIAIHIIIHMRSMAKPAHAKNATDQQGRQKEGNCHASHRLTSGA